MTSAPILALRDGKKTWRTRRHALAVLSGADLTVECGQSVAIIGPSGCGKSTLLHVLAMLTPLDSGQILFDGHPVSRRTGWWSLRIRRSIGFVFQDGKLVPGLRVLENVALPLAHRGMWPARQRSIARDMLERVGLGERAEHFPRQLSGGELTRAAIARALVYEPRVLLCDEPTGSLDRDTAERIASLLFDAAGQDCALVIVTHSAELAAKADVTYRLLDGRLRPADGAS
jgi:putative ABC transport system ATP-binding protein